MAPEGDITVFKALRLCAPSLPGTGEGRGAGQRADFYCCRETAESRDKAAFSLGEWALYAAAAPGLRFAEEMDSFIVLASPADITAAPASSPPRSR